MISIETLRAKPEIKNAENENIIDLTSNTYDQKNVNIKSIAMVTSELEMRPDLVARIYYGNSNKLDYILKFNGISNPFSLEAGTYLFIGEEGDLDACFSKGTTENVKESDIRDESAKRLSKKDAARLALLRGKIAKAASPGTGLTPNFAQIGATEMTAKPNGSVVLGQDNTTNLNNCTVPHSKAIIKAKLLQQKIFRTA